MRNVRVAFEGGNTFAEVTFASTGPDPDDVRRALLASGYRPRRPDAHTALRWLRTPTEIVPEMKLWGSYARDPSSLPALPKRSVQAPPRSRPGTFDRRLLAQLRALSGWRCFAVSAERRRRLEGRWHGWSILAWSRAIEDGGARFHVVEIQLGGGTGAEVVLSGVVRGLRPWLTEIGLRNTNVPRALGFAHFSSERLNAAEAVRMRRRVDDLFDHPH